ncbi:MAG: hypothetical protein RIQ56_502 [Candidatus Parcubacteria bacterium]|jgi:endonuclease/exonuclease/phosphatase family metal-dependent hydrolase
MSVSLISVNIERSKHLEKVIPFLENKKPDVVCVQELMEYDVSQIEHALGASCLYFPATRHQAEGKSGILGIGIFSRLPVIRHAAHFYAGEPGAIKDFDSSSHLSKRKTENHFIALADITAGDSEFRVCTTHFTWTPDGLPDEHQRTDAREMMRLLETFGEFVLCGDFNAPRGGEIFSLLTSKYRDNIPAKYVTSLDVNLHRATKEGRRSEIENKMVDGLFTTTAYSAAEVSLEFGISDHAAVVGLISKK